MTGGARGGRPPHARQRARRYAAGMKVRREVLGDAHVDRATAATTDFTREFQELITQYAWGAIWTRPGLDRRSRSHDHPDRAGRPRATTRSWPCTCGPRVPTD